KKDLSKLLGVLLLGSIPVIYYVLTLGNLIDMSLLRYLGLIFFISPYLFYVILPEIRLGDTFKKFLFLAIFSFLPILLLSKTIIEYDVNFEFTVHTGQYKDFIW